jgi:hypothetical protein
LISMLNPKADSPFLSQSNHLCCSYHDKNPPSTISSSNDWLFPPSPFDIEVIGADAILTWGMPSGGLGRFCSQPFWAFDSGTADEFTIAMRVLASEQEYFLIDDTILTHVMLVSMYENAEFKAKIWFGGSDAPLNPGVLVHEQYIGTIPTEQFVYIELDSQITIPDDQELWIGFHIVTHGGNPATTDSCGESDGFSNLIYIDGEWTTLRQAYDRTSSWFIGGRVISLSQMQEFIGFHVFRETFEVSHRDYMLTQLTANPTTELYLTDKDFPFGLVSYYVTAIYSYGTSLPGVIVIDNDLKAVDSFPWFDGFEYLYPLGWQRFFDTHPQSIWEHVFSGNNRFMRSRPSHYTSSWQSGNWLISPLLKLPIVSENQSIFLKFLMSSQAGSPGTADDFFSLLVSTTDKSFQSFESVFTETVYGSQWYERKYDISEHQGKEIYLAFRHFGGGATSIVSIDDIWVGVADATSQADMTIYPAFRLSAYPNPFNPMTTISYSTKTDSHVNLEIYNARGQKIKTLISDFRVAGEHSVVWDGTDDSGNSMSSGIYFYRLKAGDFVSTKKFTLLK